MSALDQALDGINLPDASDGTSHGLDDIGNGRRLIDRHGQNLRHIHDANQWYIWDGARWTPDAAGEVDRCATETLTTGLAEELNTAYAPGGDGWDAFAKFAVRSHADQRVRACIARARSHEAISVRPEDFDADPELLNTASGVIDLRTGDLREHRRDDLMSRITPVAYKPHATAPLWDAFLGRILPDHDVRACLQRALGAALVGRADDQILPILTGVGANGKSVLTNTVLSVLGDYGLTAAADLMIDHGRRGGASPEVAELEGRRLVVVSETDESAPLAEGRVKNLTGGDRVKGRALYAGYRELNITWSLFLVTNHLPRIKGGPAIWRRILVIPFDVVIPEHERDPKLAQKLAAESPGILRWLVDGCTQWRETGIAAPAAIQHATTTYQGDSDPIEGWIADNCHENPHIRTPFADLWDSYETYHRHRPPITRDEFAKRLDDRGYESVRTKTARYRIGLALTDGDQR